LAPLRVLLVDDNLFNQKVGVAKLEGKGHTVCVAGSGGEALAALDTEPFDLVLMDMMMPDMDGIEATAAIRRRETTTGRRIPVIAVTAHAKIYLPRARDAAPAVRPSLLLTGRPAPSPGAETVLLVEDEDGVRALARTILQVNRYTVLEARDGTEALRLTSDWSRPIDLMVTDVVMPQLSGYQLADRLKPARPGMKVLFMSGYTDDAICPHRVLGPDAHFLQKPFTPDVLARKVREVLDE
jgi:CheY-like chemotaxis protein